MSEDTGEYFVILNDEKIYVNNDSLDLRNRGIKNLHEIIGLKKLTKLINLDLSHNQLTDINYKILQSLTLLTSLNLSYNKISTTQGIRRLRNLFAFQVLDLRGNEVFEVPDFGQLSRLQKIYLEETPVYDRVKDEPFFKERRDLTAEEELEGLIYFSNPPEKVEYPTRTQKRLPLIWEGFKGSPIAATINFFTFGALGGYLIAQTAGGSTYLIGPIIGGFVAGCIGAFLGFISGRILLCYRC